MSRHVFVVAIAGLMAACTARQLITRVVPLRTLSPPTGRPAELYIGDVGPSRAFEEVAMLQIIGAGLETSEEVADALRTRGGQLGCDAVVHVQINAGHTRAHGFGVCVTYTVSAPAPAPVAPASDAPAAPASNAPAPASVAPVS